MTVWSSCIVYVSLILFNLRFAISEDINSSFVSFEEWKQSKGDDIEGISESSRRVREVADPSCYKAGDSYGEEMEIELGFLSGDEVEPEGRVYKDKYNYASLDCAATIVKTNSEAVGATSILIENKDKYLLNPCHVENQFIVIELCEDILVEEIKVGNFEYFSSTFKKLRFYVSARLPVSRIGWTLIGEFEAENSRYLQTFVIENPKRWARYLRIEVLSHYGNEFYCPISLTKVHGQTMMDEFKLGETEPQSNVEMENKYSDIEETDPIEKDFVGVAKNDTVGKNVIEYEVCLPEKYENFMKEANCILVEKFNITSVNSRKPTEESIFKNIIKRLNTLENNSTLTVQYIEEQNRLLTQSMNSSIAEMFKMMRKEFRSIERRREVRIASLEKERRYTRAIVLFTLGIAALIYFRVFNLE